MIVEKGQGPRPFVSRLAATRPDTPPCVCTAPRQVAIHVQGGGAKSSVRVVVVVMVMVDKIQ